MDIAKAQINNEIEKQDTKNKQLFRMTKQT